MSKIIGLGNALVDIIVFIDNDELLNRLQLPKGSMTLVDFEKSTRIRETCEHLPSSFASGGSAANTINALARLGIETSYIGKVGEDEYGSIFRQDLVNNKVDPILLPSSIHTGRAVALISPDKERTFATHLGAAIELNADDLQADQFSGHSILHIEGYAVQNHALLEKALRLAKDQGLKVSLDLASYNVVEENLEFLQYIVKDYVDIVFANEEESKSFTGKDPAEALDELANVCSIAIVKIGKDGSMVRSGSESHHVKAIQAKVIDTNGAGDIYAAGFLYGLSQGWPINKCAHMGGLLAGKIIEVIGARLDENSWQQIPFLIQEI